MLYWYLYMKSWLGSLAKREEGQDLIEYALLIVFIAIVVIAALIVLGPVIRSVYYSIRDSLSGAPGTG